MSGTRDRLLLVAALGVALAVALGGQAFADAQLQEASGEDTSRAVGRAATAYLTGLRTYGAAALWNRIEPLLHNYYEGVPLEDQLYMLSSITVVQWLDPHAIRSYSVGSWLLVRNERVDEGLEMAERGVAENAKSGIALSSLAQIQYLYGDRKRATEAAKLAMAGDVEWLDPRETYTWLAILSDILESAGEVALHEEAEARMIAINESLGNTLPEAHDHDGDGVVDH